MYFTEGMIKYPPIQSSFSQSSSYSGVGAAFFSIVLHLTFIGLFLFVIIKTPSLSPASEEQGVAVVFSPKSLDHTISSSMKINHSISDMPAHNLLSEDHLSPYIDENNKDDPFIKKDETLEKRVHNEIKQKEPKPSPKVHKEKKVENVSDLFSTLENLRKQKVNESAKEKTKASFKYRKGSDHGQTQSLNESEQSGIANEVRQCYEEDALIKNYSDFSAHLIVTVDEGGEAHMVEFSPDTKDRMENDPSYRAFAERARFAILNPRCAHLPIPQRFLGSRREFRFVFHP